MKICIIGAGWFGFHIATKLIDEGYAYPFESLLEKCDNIKTLNTTKEISKNILSIIKQ